MSIINLLKRPKNASTSDQIKIEIEAAEAKHAAAASAIDRYRDERAIALLDAGDAKIHEIDAAISEQMIRIDRADALLHDLQQRLGNAEQRERAERIDAAYGRACACRDEVARLLRQYGAEAVKLAELLGEVVRLDTERKQMNAAVAGEGDPRRADAPERLLTERDEYAVDLALRVWLPSVSSPRDLHWPPANAKQGGSALDKAHPMPPRCSVLEAPITAPGAPPKASSAGGWVDVMPAAAE